MRFDTLPFLIFLPVVFLAHWALPGRRGRNALLLVASYVFYGWWDWRFLALIAGSSAVDYLVGLRLPPAGRRARRGWLAGSVAVNLGALATFKYLGWGVESFAAIVRAFGMTPHAPTLELVLPVGISFYTFQTLSYTIDVYRGRLAPTRDALAFFTFVAFFPQLVAGPIERAERLLPQFVGDRRFDRALASDGLRQMIYGLFLKRVVADNLAPFVDRVYGDLPGHGPWWVAMATWAFAFQIYGDFAGYSHLAIGCGRLFGVQLSRNFAYPYFSRSPAELWHRWHVSLSTWFRDYVYIPLGGSRVGPLRRRLNVLVTFVLSGVWHGAGWTYVAWGAFHGLLVAAQWWNPRTVPQAPLDPGVTRAGRRRWLPRPGALLAAVVTFQLTCVGWVLFRAPSIDAAGVALAHLARLPLEAPPPPDDWPAALRFVPLLLAIEWPARRERHPLRMRRAPPAVRWLAAAVLLFLVVLFAPYETIPFLYFQF